MAHPVAIAYADAIHLLYNKRINPANCRNAETISDVISQLGVSYNVYMYLAVRMTQKWSKQKGMAYPYWSVVTSKFAVDKVAKLIELQGDVISLCQQIVH